MRHPTLRRVCGGRIRKCLPLGAEGDPDSLLLQETDVRTEDEVHVLSVRLGVPRLARSSLRDGM